MLALETMLKLYKKATLCLQTLHTLLITLHKLNLQFILILHTLPTQVPAGPDPGHSHHVGDPGSRSLLEVIHDHYQTHDHDLTVLLQELLQEKPGCGLKKLNILPPKCDVINQFVINLSISDCLDPQ